MQFDTALIFMQATEKESENAVREACASLRESLDSLTQQTGSLSLARQVLDKTFVSRVPVTSSSGHVVVGEPDGGDDFITLQVYYPLQVLPLRYSVEN